MKRRPFLVIILVILFSLLLAPNSLSLQANQKISAGGTIAYGPINPTLFDRTVTWADGSTERWTIDDKKQVLVNGVSARLVGFCYPFEALDLRAGLSGLDTVDKEIYWMGTQGIRVLEINWWRWWGDKWGIPTVLGRLLEAAYRNKMMVIMSFTYMAVENFNGRVTDAVRRYLEDALNYAYSVPKYRQIILTIKGDNEYNQYAYLNRATYMLTDLDNYCKGIRSICKGIFPDVPFSISVAGYDESQYPGLITTIGKSCDICLVQAYGDKIGTSKDHGLGFSIYRVKGGHFDGVDYVGMIGDAEQWFLTETGAQYNGLDTRYYMPFLGDYAFSVGASVVILWTMHRHGAPEKDIFSATGDPGPVAKNVAYFAKDTRGTPYVHKITPFTSRLIKIDFSDLTLTFSLEPFETVEVHCGNYGHPKEIVNVTEVSYDSATTILTLAPAGSTEIKLIFAA